MSNISIIQALKSSGLYDYLKYDFTEENLIVDDNNELVDVKSGLSRVLHLFSMMTAPTPTALKPKHELPTTLYLKQNRYDTCGTKLEYIKSCSLADYYAKCQGSSSTITFVCAHERDAILQGTHGSLFVSYEALENSAVAAAKQLLERVEQDKLSHVPG